ncbi:hypothetical protein ACFPRL_36445 [Pseudoclavibacter helvolus]
MSRRSPKRRMPSARSIVSSVAAALMSASDSGTVSHMPERVNQTSMRSKSCSTSPTPSPLITAATPRSTAMSICGPGPWVSVAGSKTSSSSRAASAARARLRRMSASSLIATAPVGRSMMWVSISLIVFLPGRHAVPIRTRSGAATLAAVGERVSARDKGACDRVPKVSEEPARAAGLCSTNRPYNRRRLPGKRTSAAGVKKHWPRSGIPRDRREPRVSWGCARGMLPPRGGRQVAWARPG